MEVVMIEVLTIDDHASYLGRRAILHELYASHFVRIMRTSRTAATVEHPDGQKQKVLWNRLSIEVFEGDT